VVCWRAVTAASLGAPSPVFTFPSHIFTCVFARPAPIRFLLFVVARRPHPLFVAFLSSVSSTLFPPVFSLPLFARAFFFFLVFRGIFAYFFCWDWPPQCPPDRQATVVVTGSQHRHVLIFRSPCLFFCVSSLMSLSPSVPGTARSSFSHL